MAATALAVGLVELVSTLSSSPTHRFLLWNLFLAWITLPLAAAAYVAHRLGFGLAAIAPFLAGWLLFFPNAPYIVTDLIHFGELNSQIPAELDLATLVAAAVAGMLVGFTSLYVVQRLITDRYGRAAGRIVVLVALVLASVGVYIGRALRWNSWDALGSPENVAADLLTRVANPFVFGQISVGVATFVAFLLVSYGLALRLAGCVKQHTGH